MESTTTSDCSWCVGRRIAEHGHERSGQSRVSPLWADMATWSATVAGRTLAMPRTFKNLPRWIPARLRLSAPQSLPSAASIAPNEIEALYVSEEVPREPWLFSPDCEHDSQRQDAEMDHLNRTDDYTVVGSGTAASAAPRTFAAHCPSRQRRQLALRWARSQTPAHHGHRTIPCS